MKKSIMTAFIIFSVMFSVNGVKIQLSKTDKPPMISIINEMSKEDVVINNTQSNESFTLKSNESKKIDFENNNEYSFGIKGIKNDAVLKTSVVKSVLSKDFLNYSLVGVRNSNSWRFQNSPDDLQITSKSIFSNGKEYMIHVSQNSEKRTFRVHINSYSDPKKAMYFDENADMSKLNEYILYKKNIDINKIANRPIPYYMVKERLEKNNKTKSHYNFLSKKFLVGQIIGKNPESLEGPSPFYKKHGATKVQFDNIEYDIKTIMPSGNKWKFKANSDKNNSVTIVEYYKDSAGRKHVKTSLIEASI